MLKIAGVQREHLNVFFTALMCFFCNGCIWQNVFLSQMTVVIPQHHCVPEVWVITDGQWSCCQSVFKWPRK